MCSPTKVKHWRVRRCDGGTSNQGSWGAKCIEVKKRRLGDEEAQDFWLIDAGQKIDRKAPGGEVHQLHQEDYTVKLPILNGSESQINLGQAQ